MSHFNFPKPPTPTPVPNNQRPSDGWLRNPSWIGQFMCFSIVHLLKFVSDGAVNPPRFYHSHDEIHATLLAWGIMPHTRPEIPSASVTPTPAGPLPSVPLDFSLVNEHEVVTAAPGMFLVKYHHRSLTYIISRCSNGSSRQCNAGLHCFACW